MTEESFTAPQSGPATGASPRRTQGLAARRTISPSLVIGAIVVLGVIAMAVVSYFWVPHDPTLVNSQRTMEGPSTQYWLGTDRYGRDVFSQIMVGSRTTLFVGVVAVGVAAVFGVPIGVLAAMAPHWLGELLMRFNDLVLAFPALLLAIMLSAVYGGSTLVAMIAIGIATIPQFARLSRSGALQVMEAQYILAARSAGRRSFAIGLRHVLPNISSLIIVQASVAFAIAVLAEAALSYLGLGTQPPTPSWGRMLHENQTLLWVAPRLSLFPGVAIAVAVLGFNLFGDGLRDLLDPKLEERR